MHMVEATTGKQALRQALPNKACAHIRTTSGRQAACLSMIGKLEAAKHRQMQQPAQTTGPRWHPQRAAPDVHCSTIRPGLALAPLTSCAISLSHPPRQVIGRRRYHPHLMAVGRQPMRHLTAVLGDTDKVGREIDPVDQEPHDTPAAGGATPFTNRKSA